MAVDVDGLSGPPMGPEVEGQADGFRHDDRADVTGVNPGNDALGIQARERFVANGRGRLACEPASPRRRVQPPTYLEFRRFQVRSALSDEVQGRKPQGFPGRFLLCSPPPEPVTPPMCLLLRRDSLGHFSRPQLARANEAHDSRHGRQPSK